MTDTPSISVSSSDKNLNQRFRKPKSNVLVFVLVGVLGVAVIATPFFLSGGNKDEEQEKQAVEQKEASQSLPQLTQTAFARELLSGDIATVQFGDVLQNAEPAKCKVEWNAKASTLPRSIIDKIEINDQLSISIPTEGIPKRTAKESVNDGNDWKLVGKIVAGGKSTKEFTINLKVNHPNTPPASSLPASFPYDPVFGADVLFSISDQETATEKLEAKFVFDSKRESDFKIRRSGDKSTIEFRPTQLLNESVEVKLEVTDAEGLTSNFMLTLSPNPKSEISSVVAYLKKEAGIDFGSTAVERKGNDVRLTVDVDGHPLDLIESQEGLNAGIGASNLVDGRSRFQKSGVVAICSSENEKLKSLLTKRLGESVKPVVPAITAKTKSAHAALVASAKELYDDKKLFNSKSFGQLVFAFVEDFERENAEELDRKYEELDGLKEFLNDQKGLKAEFFLAIDPVYDNLSSAMNVLNEIRIQHPNEIVLYKNLAIAISVCWDVPTANYSFVGHQRRTKSIMPENLTGALENFKHFVTYQDQMQGRAQWLPWEFLVHVINHQTPDTEKYWALENYLANRAMFGKCYKEVPYDFEMLNTKSQVCKLGGKEYSLPNLKAYGGVCAMQADFAARVGKSLGVPSEYVGGQSANGENHAWVMWVEIKNVTRSGIAFTLESFGRYRGDQYYVGSLKDPKSGQRITDRQLELRLHTVGTDAYSKRHVDLLMKIFPEFIKSHEMDIKEQLKFLEQAIKLCPWHEESWNAVADLIANNEIDKKMHRQMNQILNSMFVHFAPFPDFTWTIFDRLVSFVPKEEDRNKYYVKLLNLYVAAKRPDLACEAQLKLTDYLEEQGKTEVAMQGLAVTIKTFPDEGRYVPRLLDRLEKLVGDDAELVGQLIQFHVDFLPLIPQKRGNRASKYCIKMYERAIQFFVKHNATEYANLYRTKLQQLSSLSP